MNDRVQIDYVRVYQRADQIDVTCDPARAPTAAYIDRHLDAYNFPEKLTWAQVKSGRAYPPNSLRTKCASSD